MASFLSGCMYGMGGSSAGVGGNGGDKSPEPGEGSAGGLSPNAAGQHHLLGLAGAPGAAGNGNGSSKKRKKKRRHRTIFTS